MTTSPTYTTRLQKGGALLSEMRLLVRLWREDIDPNTLAAEILATQALGRVSRTRIRDVITRIFIPRYVAGDPPHAWRYLRPFEEADAPLHIVRPLYYFYAARAEALLGDFVRLELYPRYQLGLTGVRTEDVLYFLRRAEQEGRIADEWSPTVARKVARGLLAALRDFGVLEGRARKRISPPYLPVIPFALIAFTLSLERQGSALLEHPDWRLFLLDRDAIERLFVEADRDGLLHFQAAGSIVRIHFPEEDTLAYARFLAARTT